MVLLDQFAGKLPVVFFQLVDARHDFVIDKLARCLGNHPMLFGEVFRRENFLRRAIFNQERSPLEHFFLFGYG